MKMFFLVLIGAFSLAGPVTATDEQSASFKYETGRVAKRTYEQAMEKASKQYAAAIRAARKDYAVALDVALRAAMDRGDLEEANRLNAAKEAVAKELAASYLTNPVSFEGTSASHEALPTLAGTWRYPNGTRIVFHSDGTYTRSWNPNDKPGTWRHVEGRRFVIAKDIVELSSDLNSFPNPNPDGKGQTVQRILPVSSAADGMQAN